MQLFFKQRFFSWFDSYDIFDESGKTVYSVQGQLSWGHKLHILNAQGKHIATVKQVVFALMPRFELYEGDTFLGCLKKQFTLFRPSYIMEYNGWHIAGNFMEWNYAIFNKQGEAVAHVDKELFHMTDCYAIEVNNPDDALYALMFTLAIDAEKCSRQQD
jgi:uncharacterized protein YxjI